MERVGRRTQLVGPLLLLLVAAGCSGGGSDTPSDSGSPSGAAPPSASAAPPTSRVVTSIEDAVAAVVGERAELADIPPFDPNRIGGCCWYRGEAVDDGYEVVFRIGWGDCPAGCIDEHTWTYRVSSDGTVELVDEGGDPVPPGGIPSDGA